MLSYLTHFIRISGNTDSKKQKSFFNRRIRQVRLKNTIRGMCYGYFINTDTYYYWSRIGILRCAITNCWCGIVSLCLFPLDSLKHTQWRMLLDPGPVPPFPWSYVHDTCNTHNIQSGVSRSRTCHIEASQALAALTESTRNHRNTIWTKRSHTNQRVLSNMIWNFQTLWWLQARTYQDQLVACMNVSVFLASLQHTKSAKIPSVMQINE